MTFNLKKKNLSFSDRKLNSNHIPIRAIHFT